VGRGRLEPPTGVPSIKKEEKRGGEREEGGARGTGRGRKMSLPTWPS
jgi:hypothetical protein